MKVRLYTLLIHGFYVDVIYLLSINVFHMYTALHIYRYIHMGRFCTVILDIKNDIKLFIFSFGIIMISIM